MRTFSGREVFHSDPSALIGWIGPAPVPASSVGVATSQCSGTHGGSGAVSPSGPRALNIYKNTKNHEDLDVRAHFQVSECLMIHFNEVEG